MAGIAGEACHSAGLMPAILICWLKPAIYIQPASLGKFAGCYLASPALPSTLQASQQAESWQAGKLACVRGIISLQGSKAGKPLDSHKAPWGSIGLKALEMGTLGS